MQFKSFAVNNEPQGQMLGIHKQAAREYFVRAKRSKSVDVHILHRIAPLEDEGVADDEMAQIEELNKELEEMNR